VKNRAARIILAVLTVAMLVLIWVMSDQPADRSGDMSLGVGRYIGRVFVSGFDKLDEAEQTGYAQKIDPTVRKTAHFAEYFLLGLLLCGDAYAWRLEGAAGVVLPVASGVLCAAIDELHQLFVPGRAGMWQDVLLDSAGVAAGCAFMLFVVFLLRKHKKKKKDPVAG
jgi:VanZ family protein